MPVVQLVPDEDGEGARRGAGTSLLKRSLRLISPRRRTLAISECCHEYKVVYLGSVPMTWVRSSWWMQMQDPLEVIWRKYTSGDRSVLQSMKLTVLQSGLRAETGRGAAVYWPYRLSHVRAPLCYPKVFCWVYRHDCRTTSHQEIRLHAVKCTDAKTAKKIAAAMEDNLDRARTEYKVFRIERQNCRMSFVNAIYPRRKILLSAGSLIYKPPLKMKTDSEHPLATIYEGDEENERRCGVLSISLRRANSRRLEEEFDEAEQLFTWL